MKMGEEGLWTPDKKLAFEGSMTLEKFKARCQEDGKCWIIVHGKVYDVEKWNEEHPGGEFIKTEFQGEDASTEFDLVSHSDAAKKHMKHFHVGNIVQNSKL